MNALYWRLITCILFLCFIINTLAIVPSAKSKDKGIERYQSIDLIIIMSSCFLYKAVIKKEYTLSESCKKIIKDADLGPPGSLGLEGGKFDFNINAMDNIVIITVTNDWFPLILKNTNNNDEILHVDFRRGEFGLKKGHIYIKEGTEARLRDIMYKFLGGSWQTLAK